MRSSSVILFLVALTFAASIDRLGFYRAFESNSQSKMESEISNLKSAKSSATKDAYLGALIMKKSQFMSTPKEKAEVFKEGRTLLEASITKEPGNGEFRFLRLAIQENVPKVLKYSSDIAADKAVILKTYGSMDATLRKVIREYSEQSSNLSPSELK